jgi:hypothetical protein
MVRSRIRRLAPWRTDCALRKFATAVAPSVGQLFGAEQRAGMTFVKFLSRCGVDGWPLLFRGTYLDGNPAVVSVLT